MSIIVGVRKKGATVIAADVSTSFGSENHRPPNYVSPKLHPVGGTVVGCAGWGLYSRIIQRASEDGDCPEPRDPYGIQDFFYWLLGEMRARYGWVNDQSSGKESGPFVDFDASFLVVSEAGVFRVSPELSVLPYTRYAAIGSGSRYAMGACFALYDTDLEARDIAVRAVRAAIEFNDGCDGDCDVWEVGGRIERVTLT